MLNGDPLDPIVIPPGDDPPEVPVADLSGLLTPLEGDAPPMVTDDGDFYWHFDEQIDLLRAQDEFVIGLETGADASAVMTALTGQGGDLEGYTLTETFGSENIVLSRPQSVEFAAVDIGGVENTTGVEWVAPSFLGEESGASVFLTEEIAVALAPGVDPDVFFGAEYSDWRRFVDQQYIATIATGGGLDALALANQLTTNPDVEWAAPNFNTVFFEQAVPNDPRFGDQWHLNNTGQNGAQVGADAELVDAWDTTIGDSGVVIAVLDDGLQVNHPDLNIFTNTGEIAGNGLDDDNNGFIDDVNGWDFAGEALMLGSIPDNDPNPSVADDSHGTAVAGIAAAIGGNSLGVTGATQTAQLLPIKINRDNVFIDSEQIADAVYYAAGAIRDANNMITGSWRGADILVNSWGGGSPSPILSAAFNWAANQAKDGQGVMSFNASGNGAGGTVPGPSYQVIQIPVTPGQKQYIWSFQTNGDAFIAGENRAWVTDIILPDGTQELLDDDNTLVGWTSTGADAWTIADDPTHSYGTARFVARAGTLTQPNQQTNLISPIINVANNSTLQFARYVSSQLQFDQFGNPISDSLVVFESTNGGAFIPVEGYAGNPFPNRPVDYPANINSTISVGASTDWDYRADYSQFGSALDIVASSGGGYATITTTDRTGTDGFDATSDYTSTFSGTSAATPLAAGIAALMLSNNADLTTAQIRDILQSTANKIGGDNGSTEYDVNGFNQFYGHGRVNAESAVDATFSVSGDFDRDRDVDGFDFLTWQRNFGSTATPVGSGADGDLSGEVDAGDLAVWESNYGETIPTPLVAAIQPAVAGEVNQPAVSTVEVADNLPSTSIEVGESSLGSFPIHLFATAFPSTETEVVAEKPVSVESRSPQMVDVVITELASPSERLSLEIEREKAEPVDAVFESIEEVLLEALV